MVDMDYDSSFEIEKLISKDFDKKFVNSIKSYLDDFLSKNNNELSIAAVKSASEVLDQLWNFYHQNDVSGFNK